MPMRAARPCAHAGCRGTAAVGRFCNSHANSHRATRPYDAWRGSSASRGYDADWRRVRVQALERDKYQCQHCLKRGLLKRATDVHHIIAVIKAPHLRLVLGNLLSLCHECHSSITATRDSSFACRQENWMKVAIFGLALLAAPLHSQVGCSERYMAVADELSQARESLATASDALYDPVDQLYRMVRAKVIGAAMGLNCTPPDLQQLDRIEAALLSKGLALTRDQLEAKQRAEEKAAWEAALQRFSRNIETLANSK